MKKIISGKKYDTTTARKVGEWENIADVRDFTYFCETLYRKRGGEYFLHGEGNAASKYCVDLGDNRWTGGERIIPLSYDSARTWAEEHLSVDEYEAEFGEVAEDEAETTTITIRVTPATKAAFDRLAARTGRLKGDLLAEAISMIS